MTSGTTGWSLVKPLTALGGTQWPPVTSSEIGPIVDSSGKRSSLIAMHDLRDRLKPTSAHASLAPSGPRRVSRPPSLNLGC